MNCITCIMGKKASVKFNVILFWILALHHQDRPKAFIESGYRFVMESLRFN